MDDSKKNQLKEKSEKLDLLIEKYDNNYYSRYDFKKEILKLFFQTEENLSQKIEVENKIKTKIEN